MKITSAMDRLEYEKIRRANEARDAEIQALRNTPPPEDVSDMGALLDHQYALHQGRNMGWDWPVFVPTPVDNSLPRDKWEKEVKKSLGGPDKGTAAGHEAIGDAYAAHVKALGPASLSRFQFVKKLREHFGLDE